VEATAQSPADPRSIGGCCKKVPQRKDELGTLADRWLMFRLLKGNQPMVSLCPTGKILKVCQYVA
jgi:hypothetical protein